MKRGLESIRIAARSRVVQKPDRCQEGRRSHSNGELWRGGLTPQMAGFCTTLRDGPSYAAGRRCSGSAARSVGPPSPSRLGRRQNSARRGPRGNSDRLLILSTLALAAFVAGCFPILLDVDKTGRVLIPRQEGVFILDAKAERAQLLYKPPAGTCAWARWSPNGKQVLVGVAGAKVSRTTGPLTIETQGTELVVVDVATRRSASAAVVDSATCAFWSPEGKAISVAEPRGEQACEIFMINLLTNEKRTVISRALPMHRWLPGGKIVAFTVSQESSRGPGIYFGELIIMNVATSDLQLVTSTICDRYAAVDVSPDGKSALLIEWVDKPGYKLSLIDLKSGTKTMLLPQDVMNAFWSPDGKHIAIVKGRGHKDWSDESEEQPAKGTKEDEKPASDEQPSEKPKPAEKPPETPEQVEQRLRALEQGLTAQLVVTDAAGKNEKVVAENIAVETAGFGEDRRPIYPTWLDANNILYFERARVYGVAGTTLRLMRVSLDGTGRKCLQLAIDEAAAKVAQTAPAGK